ncbi:hypothetical protein [Enterococcus pallens]|uniref:Uncharacterized protein n=1 Tax=Enterococcus pallens ATCC BAA-351 TaxID=1158607 RepID=R2SJT4_9ENTE|nr:hypothetical protein [Enterococcus pallens]EOH93166.1 hypothetical protein UAU_02809 [Enterococcus pallens ATCC BAA-351]EOU24952.1 hypothetical protein I588_00940 [Enterococcus pallens ATCC BAA-351]
MTTKNLQLTQLTTMKRKGLERRFPEHFAEHHAIQHIVESAIFVLVRNAFSPCDFSFLGQELICRIFLEGNVQELASVRHFCVYVKEYFTPEDWEKVLSRLFESHEEYLAVTKATREKTDHLHEMLHSGSREAKELINISTVYKDANGKKHRFTLKDTDPCYSIEETTALLSILSSLTILEKDGVRRFTELVRYIYLPTEPVYDSEREAEKEVEAEPADDMLSILQPQISKAMNILAQMETQLEGGSAETVPFLESSDYLKNNVYAGKSLEGTTEFLLDGFTLPPETDETELLSRLLTAFAQGIKLKDAQAEFVLSDEPENTPDPDSDKKTKTEKLPNKKKSKKNKNKKQNSYESPEEIRKKKEQWEQKRLKRRLDKKMGKSKRNKKKRK